MRLELTTIKLIKVMRCGNCPYYDCHVFADKNFSVCTRYDKILTDDQVDNLNSFPDFCKLEVMT